MSNIIESMENASERLSWKIELLCRSAANTRREVTQKSLINYAAILANQRIQLRDFIARARQMDAIPDLTQKFWIMKTDEILTLSGMINAKNGKK